MVDEFLDAARDALQNAGLAAFVADASGRVVGVTDDLLLIFGGGVERPEVPLGSHVFSEEWVSFQARAPGGPTPASQREVFRGLAPALAAELGGVEALSAVVDPRLHDLLEDRRVLMEPVESVDAVSFDSSGRALALDDGSAITIIDAVTGRRLAVVPQDLGPPMAWGPTGDIGISDGRAIDAIDIDTFRLERSWKRRINMAPGDWYVQSLSWSPDGRRLAFGGDRTKYLGARRPSAKPADCGCVDVFDIFVVATGKTRRLTRTGVAGQPVWSPNGKEIAFVNSGAIMVMAAGGRHMRTVAAGYNQLFDWAVSPH